MSRSGPRIPPTLIPPMPSFPFLLPDPPQPHPMPLSSRGGYVRFSSRRDLHQEADDLSDEEAEVEDAMQDIKHWGESFLIPLGKQMTLEDEKADENDSSEGESSDHSPAPSEMQNHENTNGGSPDAVRDQLMRDLDDDILDEDEEEDDTGEVDDAGSEDPDGQF